MGVALVDLGFSVYHRYVESEPTSKSIGYAAHLGGAAAGFLVGMNVMRNFRVEVCTTVYCIL